MEYSILPIRPTRVMWFLIPVIEKFAFITVRNSSLQADTPTLGRHPHLRRHPTLGRHPYFRQIPPSRQTPLYADTTISTPSTRRPLQRTVRILLEYILGLILFCFSITSSSCLSDIKTYFDNGPYFFKFT